MHISRFARKALCGAATSAVALSSTCVLAQFTSIDTFIAATPALGPYSWDNSANWKSGVLPTKTTLVQFDPQVFTAGTLNYPPSGQSIYGLDFTVDSGGSTFNITGGTLPLILNSTETFYDAANNHAPAVHMQAGANGTIQLRAPVQLGDGTNPTGIMTIQNDATTGVTLQFDKVTQLPGTTYGVTFTGPGLTTLRAVSGSGNYLLNRWDITGQITVARNADNTNARIFMNNSILPVGSVYPSLQLDGGLINFLNGNALVLNAINSNYTSATMSSSRANSQVAFGADNRDGDFAGAISGAANATNASSYYKIGTGNQLLSNGTSNFQHAVMIGGTLSVNSIADQGTGSAIGSGSLTFDGGAVKYTGSGHSSNRVLEIGFRGGTIDASGTGSLTLNGTVLTDDVAYAFGDNYYDGVGGTSQFVTNMFGISGLGALAGAGNLQITAGAAGITGAVGTQPVSVNEGTRVMELAAGATNGTPGNGSGLPRITFTTVNGIARTLNLTGSNTDLNSISGVVGDSSVLLGGVLNLRKTGAGTWKLSGTNTYTGTTTVEGGKLILAASGVGTNAWGPVLGSGGGADVKGGRLIFDYTLDPAANPAAQVKSILTTGYGQVTKFSSGKLRTSNTPNAARGLGWTDDGTSQVKVAYTYYGDTNLDGQVDLTDLVSLSQHWTQAGVWGTGDFNYDNTVDLTDLVALSQNWNAGVGNPLGPSFDEALASVGLGDVVVPEPSLMALAGVGILALRRRR